MGFPGGSGGKESVCNAGDLGSVAGQGDPQEKGMAAHSNILAWRILWTEEPGGLQSWASLVAQLVKNPPAVWETWVRSLGGGEDPLEKGQAHHCSILAWRIPWTI